MQMLHIAMQSSIKTLATSRESIQPCNGLANNKRVDIVSAFVRVNRLQVVRVAANRIFKCNTVCAKNGASFTRCFERLTHIITFRNRNLYWMKLSIILEAPEL